MTWFELVELVQNIVIVIWFLWPARYRIKGACVVRHSHGDWTINSLLYNTSSRGQSVRTKASCTDQMQSMQSMGSGESSFRCETFSHELAHLDDKPLGAAL